jgi:hypothetical protein
MCLINNKQRFGEALLALDALQLCADTSMCDLDGFFRDSQHSQPVSAGAE